jgi:hypothetical protein
MRHEHQNRGPVKDAWRADFDRCLHRRKKLLPDGSFWCEPCGRIVGFLRIPTKVKPT